MNEQAPVYYADLIPTPAELKLLARLRKLRGMCIVDSDCMRVWPTLKPEDCNGKHVQTIEEQIIDARNA